MRPDINPMVGFTGEGAFIRGPGSEVRMEAPAEAGRINRVTLYLRAPENNASVNEYHINLDYGTGKATRTVTLKPDSTGKAEFDDTAIRPYHLQFQGIDRAELFGGCCESRNGARHRV